MNLASAEAFVTGMGMVALTERLRLRHLSGTDAGFILELLNEPAFHQHIGDRGVRTLEQAHDYLREGPMSSYALHGHGLYAVERSADGERLGICGLVHRDYLPQADIGFAFLARYEGQGYAQEAAHAVLQHAREVLEMDRVLAIVAPGNARSIRLLEKLGLRFLQPMRLPGDGEELKLYAIEWRR